MGGKCLLFADIVTNSFCLLIPQLWESILRLKTPDDNKEISEGWNRTVSAVIRKRVEEVSICKSIHIILLGVV